MGLHLGVVMTALEDIQQVIAKLEELSNNLLDDRTANTIWFRYGEIYNW